MDDWITGRVRRTASASALLVVAAVAAACGAGSDPLADGGSGALVPADDCAGERGGPVAAVGMDAATGEERWSRRLGDLGQQVDAGGVLVVLDRQGAATGVDPATGRALWCRPGGPEVDSTVSPAGTIAIADGSTVIAFSAPDTLVAFDGRTGQDLWATTTPESIMALPRLRGDQLLLVENVAQATLVGQVPDTTFPVLATVDLATGSLVDGPAEVPMMETAVPTDGGGGVLVSQKRGPEPYRVTVVVSDAVTGAERWRLTRRGAGAFAVDDLVVVVDQGENLSQADPGTVVDTLVAYSAADGTELWTTRMDAPWPWVTGAGDLVMWSSPGLAVAIDEATGQVRWRADHGSPGMGGDQTEPGRYGLFVPSADGTVVAGVITAEEPYRD